MGWELLGRQQRALFFILSLPGLGQECSPGAGMATPNSGVESLWWQGTKGAYSLPQLSCCLTLHATLQPCLAWWKARYNSWAS